MRTSGTHVARGLAEAFLAGAWEPASMAERGRLVLGATRRDLWIRKLASSAVDAFGPSAPPPRRRVLEQFLARSRTLTNRLSGWLSSESGLPQVSLTQLGSPPMTPVAALAERLAVPSLTTPGELATWLEVTPAELDWFADAKGLLARRRAALCEPLAHYRFELRAKPRGRFRLLEIPKARLKRLQRRILDGILALVPLHEAAHAFRPGRSIVSCVEPHAGREVVIAIDLREFFPSVHAGRVNATFRSLGYPERVARLLTGLCTTRTPGDVLDDDAFDHIARQFLRSPHLPQGAPTSPALANLAAWRLDARLSGLAPKFGAGYTRYADDLIFSGDRNLKHAASRLRIAACAIVLDEGFVIHRRKTRTMLSAGRQEVGGLVINDAPNVPRAEYEVLRAILHNCVRFGPESQNRGQHPNFRDYLRGRIAWVQATNETRACRLMAEFERIEWPE